VVSPPDPAATVLALAQARPATLGTGRLVCVDGPAGSGKTTLATSVSAAVPGGGGDAAVVHMDDLYPGWDGLDAVSDAVMGVLAPLADGRPGHYRRWDWHASCHAEEHVVEPAPVLVLEGVASGNLAWARWCTALVWVESDADTRLARGLARDGEALRDRWVRWMAQEQVVFARERTRERADLVVRT
jgi:uridine kinase